MVFGEIYECSLVSFVILYVLVEVGEDLCMVFDVVC